MRKARSSMSIYSELRKSPNHIGSNMDKIERDLEPIKKDDPWLARFDPSTFEVLEPTEKQIKKIQARRRKSP